MIYEPNFEEEEEEEEDRYNGVVVVVEAARKSMAYQLRNIRWKHDNLQYDNVRALNGKSKGLLI